MTMQIVPAGPEPGSDSWAAAVGTLIRMLEYFANPATHCQDNVDVSVESRRMLDKFVKAGWCSRDAGFRA
jgi:hypothetical protein